MDLYTYYRSSAAYRVRIALNLKGLDYQAIAVHLAKAEQRETKYLAVNPLGLLPALDIDGQVLIESQAIMEYLEEAYPDTPLLPESAFDRAHVRALAQLIACDIHPLNNSRVLNYLAGPLAVDQDARVAWYQYWVAQGFAALEQLLAKDPRTGRFCVGDQPTLADCALIPQVYNAKRFNCDLSAYPTLTRIADHANSWAAFQRAAPEAQADFE